MATDTVLNELILQEVTQAEYEQLERDNLLDENRVYLTPDNSLKGILLDFKWADHLLDDISWLRADTFSWQSGDVYVAAYNHLVSCMAGATEETETIAGIEITYYLAQNKRKICLPDQESNIAALYESTGVAWYYILDTVNKQFKLPRSKHNKYADIVPVVGNGIGIGLYDGTDNAALQTGGMGNGFGYALTGSKTNFGVNAGTDSTNTGLFAADKVIGLTTDPEKSGLIAQQEQDTDQYKYLYFYVGNFERDAVEQTAGIAAEMFNSKADSDLGNIPANYDYVVESQMPTAENGYTWYRKYKSGWVEQGGINTSSGAPSGYITLIIPMRSTDYWVMGQWRGSSAIDTGAAKSNYNYAEPYSTTQILVGCYNTTNPCVWQVCGVAE